MRITKHGGAVASQLSALSSNMKGSAFRGQSVAVPCAPLRQLMAAARLKRAHFLSLDVEGAEDMVLATVDPAVFSVVLVEVSGHDPAKDGRVLTRLAAAGLFRLPSARLAKASADPRFAKVNAVYVKNSSFEQGWLDRWLSGLG